MRDRVIEALADRLFQAECDRTPVPPIRDELAPGGIPAAYAVQQHNEARAIASGRRVIGRKIGLTSAAVQRQVGVGEPDFGVLFADMCDADGDTVDTHRVLQPKVEAEVAVVLKHSIEEPDVPLFKVVEAIEYLLPAIEIVGSRIADWDISILDTVADNASCGRVVLGLRPVRPDAIDLARAGMEMTVDGATMSVGSGAACLGHPYKALAWLAKRFAALGHPLRAGDLVMTGALGPMVPIGQSVTARIQGLGDVSVRIEQKS